MPVVVTLPVIGGAELAARYYQAAAALTSNDSYAALSIEERNRTLKALRGASDWTPDAIAVARLRIEQNRDALDFVDRAAVLPFGGFLPGTSYQNRIRALMQLAEVCEFRAVVLAADGKGDAAAASLYSEARLARALDAVSMPSGTSVVPSFTSMTAILARAKPSPASLIPLSGGLEALDRDDRLKETFIRFRASMLNEVMMSRPPSLQPGAFTAHLTVRSLDALARIIAAADQPWTTRISAINAVGIWPQPDVFALGSRGPKMLVDYTHAIADQMKRIRCARLNLDATLNLVDPLTGRGLAAAACHL